MRSYALLRLLLAGFFLYFAWPFIPGAETIFESIFWIMWLAFFLLVAGANFSTLLQMTPPPIMEQETRQKRQAAED